MSERRYPNESKEYRESRDALLKEEAALVDHVKAVAKLRRQLPLGGRLKEDYIFEWASNEKLGQNVKFSELFGSKDTLLLYSFMFGPSWDNPCPSCTSVVDALDRMAYSVSRDAAFFTVGKAPAIRINDWANKRGWSQIDIISGYECSYQADYNCQSNSDDRQFPTMHVFKKTEDGIFHFWGTELTSNDLDMIWPYWNLMDLTPKGRPDRSSPPQNFTSRYIKENYLDGETND
ncbi:DUF899 family protein [Sphingorhabdus sp. EL138]|uniref:DUF899 family protein n=1 Tax=Sphingorhabdus sp. EL138 TaxID=2073156 RepID=UPI000D68DDBA|nr:DUF899 family protein [Sphingorhabdus sp. EL138]